MKKLVLFLFMLPIVYFGQIKEGLEFLSSQTIDNKQLEIKIIILLRK